MDKTLRALACAAALSCGMSTGAQTLPQGMHHANRTRTYDIRHYTADLRFDMERGSIRGHVAIDLAPLVSLRTIDLDAIGLEVEAVSVDGNAVDFEVADKQLRIRLARAAESERSMTVEVDYTAQPAAGMYFQDDPRDSARRIVSTYGEGGLHAN